jgi:hypothetical protein
MLHHRMYPICKSEMPDLGNCMAHMQNICLHLFDTRYLACIGLGCMSLLSHPGRKILGKLYTFHLFLSPVSMYRRCQRCMFFRPRPHRYKFHMFGICPEDQGSRCLLCKYPVYRRENLPLDRNSHRKSHTCHPFLHIESLYCKYPRYIFSPQNQDNRTLSNQNICRMSSRSDFQYMCLKCTVCHLYRDRNNRRKSCIFLSLK